jgi:hypothetical protein
MTYLPDPDDPLGILRADRDAEIDSRAHCENCGASYHARWAGTVCSRCDGKITNRTRHEAPDAPEGVNPK